MITQPQRGSVEKIEPTIVKLDAKPGNSASLINFSGGGRPNEVWLVDFFGSGTMYKATIVEKTNASTVLKIIQEKDGWLLAEIVDGKLKGWVAMNRVAYKCE